MVALLKSGEHTQMFTSVRSKMNRYKDFSLILSDGNQVDFDEDKLLDHFIDRSGILTLTFVDNHKQVYRNWLMLDYTYNLVQ